MCAMRQEPGHDLLPRLTGRSLKDAYADYRTSNIRAGRTACPRPLPPTWEPPRAPSAPLVITGSRYLMLSGPPGRRLVIPSEHTYCDLDHIEPTMS